MTETRKLGNASSSILRDITLTVVALLNALLLFLATQTAHRFDTAETRMDAAARERTETRERAARLEAQYESIQRDLQEIKQAIKTVHPSR